MKILIILTRSSQDARIHYLLRWSVIRREYDEVDGKTQRFIAALAGARTDRPTVDLRRSA
jgi:hypothetical protein